MKERLLQLLDLEQLTPSKFADIIGVQRSSVSHVLSGRNNPSFDFLQKTLKSFPGLNADWLMLGKGTMYEQMGRTHTGTLFEATAEQDEREDIPHDPGTPQAAGDEKTDLEAMIGPAYDSPDEAADAAQTDHVEMADREAEGPQIRRVVLLYSDGTFASFEPS